MERFCQDHSTQLQALDIPPVLYPGLWEQLEQSFGCVNPPPSTDESVFTTDERIVQQLPISDLKWTSAGALLVIRPICEWDIQKENGLWQALSTQVSLPSLRVVQQGLNSAQLKQPFHSSSVPVHQDKEETSCGLDPIEERVFLQNEICASPQTWARITLYSKNGKVRAALPAPPYYQVSNLASGEADLTGPFPFFFNQRERQSGEVKVIPTFLAYWGEKPEGETCSPTLDLVPPHTCPNDLVRALRHVALFGVEAAPPECWMLLQQVQAVFIHEMHKVRQLKLECQGKELREKPLIVRHENEPRIWKVYTDAGDPLGLSHPDTGLETSSYQLVEDAGDADIIFSFESLFHPKCSIYDHSKNKFSAQPQLINQFPYEGAWVQKDHLARGILEQHGFPLPVWALESFDLDVQLAQFVAMASSMSAASEAAMPETTPPLWIVKPAHGTQSRGHVVTHSLGHVLKLLDAGKPPSRVVQRYLSSPVTHQGRKVDCRCLVVLYSCDPLILFLHKRVYFRIAEQRHSVAKPQGWINRRVILTATHLFANDTEANAATDDTESNNNQHKGDDSAGKLPVDHKTITSLEAEYPGDFDWRNVIWPKIQTMVRELFSGMKRAYADNLRNTSFCRAVYGIDIMFENVECENGSSMIEPKLTEVTFCPSNNGESCRPYISRSIACALDVEMSP